MKTLVRGTGALAFMMFVVSCSGLLKKKDGDGGLEASVADVGDAAGTTPAAAGLATNEADITRYPDETKLADVSATLQRGYNVRQSTPAGTVVTVLPKGAVVTQIASHGGAFLITFDSPTAPGTKLMGWIYRDAFSAVVADAGPPTCPKGDVLVMGDVPFCGHVCQDDSACPAGQACKGQANKLLPNGKTGDGLTVCTVFTRTDAGAPTPPTPPSAVDAGKPTTVDAGPTPPAPTGADEVAPTNGACPASFQLVTKTGKCHRSCPGGVTAHQCAASSFCIKCDKDNKKVCALDRNECK